MKSIVNLLRAVSRDGPIVGYGPYITYRYRTYRQNKTPMRVEVAGQKVLVRPSTPDLRVAFQSLRRELDILRDLLPKDFSGLIVDAGGYIGTAAIKLSTMYPKATIVSIEASDANYEVLARNVADHTNIHAIKAALFAKSGLSMPLRDRGTGEWGFSIAVKDATTLQGDVGTVETITLEDILARFPGKSIGLIKIDIEGGEYEIFKDRLSTMHSVPIVFVELHDRIIPGCTDAFLAFSAARWVVNAGGEKLLSLKGKPAELQA